MTDPNPPLSPFFVTYQFMAMYFIGTLVWLSQDLFSAVYLAALFPLAIIILASLQVFLAVAADAYRSLLNELSMVERGMAIRLMVLPVPVISLALFAILFMAPTRYQADVVVSAVMIMIQMVTMVFATILVVHGLTSLVVSTTLLAFVMSITFITLINLSMPLDLPIGPDIPLDLAIVMSGIIALGTCVIRAPKAVFSNLIPAGANPGFWQVAKPVIGRSWPAMLETASIGLLWLFQLRMAASMDDESIPLLPHGWVLTLAFLVVVAAMTIAWLIDRYLPARTPDGRLLRSSTSINRQTVMTCVLSLLAALAMTMEPQVTFGWIINQEPTISSVSSLIVIAVVAMLGLVANLSLTLTHAARPRSPWPGLGLIWIVCLPAMLAASYMPSFALHGIWVVKAADEVLRATITFARRDPIAG